MIYELDHWVLFDSMTPDQIARLKNVISTKAAPASEKPVERGLFQSLLETETAKLEK
jgi:hypothetical protein